MNWLYYFNRIQTQQDFHALHKTGMAWELFPDCPCSWKEHLELHEKFKAGLL